MPKKKDGSKRSKRSKSKGSSKSSKKHKKDRKSVAGSTKSKHSSADSKKSKGKKAKKPKPDGVPVEASGGVAPSVSDAPEDPSGAPPPESDPAQQEQVQQYQAPQEKETPSERVVSVDGNADYLGMYRNVPANGVGVLKPLHVAFKKFHPWRPKKDLFMSSGYYLDMDGGGDDGLKPNEIRIHNLPPGIKDSDILKKFPTGVKVRYNDDGTAIVEFKDPPAAEKAYHDTDLVKLGNRNVAWVNPDEVYVVGVPPNLTAGDLNPDFPNNKGIKFIDEPGLKRVAIVKLGSPKEADQAYEDAPYKKLGNRQLGYEMEENPLRLVNAPPNLTEDDVKKKFPTAKSVHLDGKGNGKIVFDNNDEANKAYDGTDLVKLGRPKVAWLKPEELALEDVPKKVTEAEIKKHHFPGAKKIKFLIGEGGKKIAIVEFPTEADQKKAYDESHHKKLGPQRLGWVGGGKIKPDPKAQLKIHNVLKGVTEDDLKKKFPTATGVKIRHGKAIVQFGSPDDADRAYDGSDMVKLGNRNLGFLGPNQLAVTDCPKKKDKPIKKDMPGLQKIEWLKGPGKSKTAIVTFPDVPKRIDGYEKSNFDKIGPQILRYKDLGDDDGDDFGLDDMDLAKKLWKLKGADFSNISNLFSAQIMLVGVPASTKGMDLIKMFDDCKKVDFQGSGPKRAAILEFDKPVSAAKAYSKAKRTKIDGKDVKVKVVPIGGFKKKKDGSRSTKSSKKK